MAQIINLDRPRVLKFGVVAARQFKKTFNVSLIDAIRPVFAGDEKAGTIAMDLDWTTNILWAALLHEQKTLTLDRTAELLQAYLDAGEGNTLKALYEQFAEALNESSRVWGLKEEIPEGKETPAQEKSPTQ